jgi:hypothetical protein
MGTRKHRTSGKIPINPKVKLLMKLNAERNQRPGRGTDMVGSVKELFSS